jgi:uncharacterized membrane protein YidH (DUF202 family)
MRVRYFVQSVFDFLNAPLKTQLLLSALIPAGLTGLTWGKTRFDSWQSGDPEDTMRPKYVAIMLAISVGMMLAVTAADHLF